MRRSRIAESLDSGRPETFAEATSQLRAVGSRARFPSPAPAAISLRSTCSVHDQDELRAVSVKRRPLPIAGGRSLRQFSFLVVRFRIANDQNCEARSRTHAEEEPYQHERFPFVILDVSSRR